MRRVETLAAAGGALFAFALLFVAFWVLRRPERRERPPGACARCTCGEEGAAAPGAPPRCRNDRGPRR